MKSRLEVIWSLYLVSSKQSISWDPSTGVCIQTDICILVCLHKFVSVRPKCIYIDACISVCAPECVCVHCSQCVGLTGEVVSRESLGEPSRVSKQQIKTGLLHFQLSIKEDGFRKLQPFKDKKGNGHTHMHDVTNFRNWRTPPSTSKHAIAISHTSLGAVHCQ